MHGDFDGKVVLIMGAAGGLGCAAARAFAAQGASLMLVDIDAVRLDALRGEIVALRAPVRVFAGDVAEPGTAHRAVHDAQTGLGRVDVLFCAAGINPASARALAATPESDWDRLVDVNLKSAYLFCQAAIAVMAAQGSGAIVLTASIAGIVASPEAAAYGISKAALIQMTRSLARDYASAGVRTNCVCPGILESTMQDRRAPMAESERARRQARIEERTPMRRTGTYSEVAQAVLFLASERTASFVNGAALVVDGGYTAV